MRTMLSVISVALLFTVVARAQDRSAPRPCVSSEHALLAVAHDYWAAFNKPDVAAMAKVLDDQLLFISESGNVLSKAEVLAPFRAPAGTITFASAEQPGDIRARFLSNTAILSFTKRWSFTHKPSGVTFGGTSRMTEVFVCSSGEWKVLAFQETIVPNRERTVFTSAVAHFDEYVGEYRFGANGKGGEIMVVRKGDKLYESWGSDRPVELVPRKFDTFFTPGFPVLERFVRDRTGRVVGILYTMGDSEVEAKRIR